MLKKIAIACGILVGIPILLSIGWGIASAISNSTSTSVLSRQVQPAASGEQPSSNGSQYVAPAPSDGQSPSYGSQPVSAPSGGQSPSSWNQPIPSVPTSTPATDVNGNPWGYDFNPGNLIYDPDSGFCNYFSCVSTFWQDTSGYVVECANGKYSHSGGVSGACSQDSGVSQILYSH